MQERIKENRYFDHHINDWLFSLRYSPIYLGVEKRWHRNGWKRYEWKVINGTKQGIAKSWLENQSRDEMITYRNGRTQGVRIDFKYPERIYTEKEIQQAVEQMNRYGRHI